MYVCTSDAHWEKMYYVQWTSSQKYSFEKLRPFSFSWKGFTCLIDKSHYKSGYRRFSVRKGVFSNFVKFIRKHLCQGLSFNKDVKQVFSSEFCESSKNTFLNNTSGRLFLLVSGGKTLSLQSTFLIKFYQPEENHTVG